MAFSKPKHAKLLFIWTTVSLFCIMIWQAYLIQDNKILVQNQQYSINSLQDSISVLEEDIIFAIEIIEETIQEKDSITTLLQKEKRKKQQIKTVIEKDTVVVTPDGRNVLDEYSLVFSNVENLTGAIYKITGSTNFKWDYQLNKPYDVNTAIDTFNMRVNVQTELIKEKDYYKIYTQPLSSDIVITYNENNILTENDYIERVPTRLGIGLIGGFGFSYQGMTPYAGIGITYSFYDIEKLFRKSKNR